MVICAPVGIANANIASAIISLVFLVGNGILKTFLKTMEKKKKQTKIVSFVKSKLYNIERIISKAPIEAYISVRKSLHWSAMRQKIIAD